MRDEFSSTIQRQKGSPCIGKLQTNHELRKQNKAKSKFKALLIVFFMLRVLSCSFFMKIRMKRYVDVKGEYIKGETKSNDFFFFNKIALCHQSCYLIATTRIAYASFNHK